VQIRLMRFTQSLAVGVFILALLIVSSGHASQSTATGAFAELRALAGDWEGKDGGGNTVRTNFKSVVSSTAILETLSVYGMEEMLTLYSIDGDGIALVHYCPTNNQPHMRAVPQSGDIKELVFLFQNATNLPDLAVGHEEKLIIQFGDKDHITEEWTWRASGKDTKMVYQLVRKTGGESHR
jgi:hypothetical protein